MLCSICRQPVSALYKKIYDDRYGYPGTFDSVSCPNCGHVALENPPSQSVLETLYTRYYPRKSVSADSVKAHPIGTPLRNWWKGERSSAFRWVPPGVKILDIGCGLGESLLYHQARGCTAVGGEADENVQSLARARGMRIEKGLFSSTMFKGETFDCVTLEQVIEHVSDPVIFLKDVGLVLAKNGTVILSTPNARGWGTKVFGRKWINWHVPYHLHVFSASSLKQVAEAAGYSVEQISTVTHASWLYYQLSHNFTYPDQGAPSAFWSFPKQRTFGQKAFFKILYYLQKFGILDFPTRILDGFDWGDNRVAILRKRSTTV